MPAEPIKFSEARWIQLHFDVSTNLGEQSSVTITSNDDGFTQTLSASSLKECGNSSVLFNGNSVSISVELDRQDRNVFLVAVKELTIGIVPTGQPLVAPPDVAQCREKALGRSDAHAVGRVMPATCTGWIVSNGAHLSAGHCHDPNDTGFNVLQFHVPESNQDGSPRHPHPRDQYCIDTRNMKSNDERQEQLRGDDWVVFGVFPNTETGLLPVQQEKAFIRLSGTAPAELGILGYAFDRINKIEKFTQQISTGGILLGERSESTPPAVYLAYEIPATVGMSGGPIIGTEGSLAFGIHTNECRGGDPAAGTSFNNVKLRDALETFAGPQTVFVDSGHPDTTEDGSIVRPFDTLEEGFKALPPGGILSVVTGVYPVTPGTTIDQSVIQTPVGPITIQ